MQGELCNQLQTSDELDVRGWDWKQDREGFMGLSEHCQDKYLFNWPGNSYPARYKYLLLCRSVVIHSYNGYYEFFYPMLTHGQNIIPIQTLSSKEDLEVVLAKCIRQLEANPIQSRHIAEAGQDSAANVRIADNLTRYWYRLLKAYAAMQLDAVD